MRKLHLVAALGLMLAASGLASANLNESQSQNRSSAEVSHLVDIGDILNNSAKYDGELVTVQGTYLGWKASNAPAMITRSDWGIEDEIGVIYVSGLAPVGIDGLDPQHDIGASLIVSAVVEKITEGPVLRAKIVTLVN